MTRATTVLAAVLFVSAVYATAEAIHHAGLNPFDNAASADSPSAAQPAPPVGPYVTASEASRDRGFGE